MCSGQQKLFQALGLGAENAPALYGEWLVLCGGAHMIARDIDAAASFARQAQPYAAALDDLAAGLLNFLQMHLRNSEGKQSAMLQAADQAQAAFLRADFLIGMIAVQRQVGHWSMDCGDSQKATLIFHEILDDPAPDRPESVHELVTVYDYAAENSYWQNDLEQAAIYQKASLALAQQLQDDVRVQYSRTMGATYGIEGLETKAEKVQFNSQFEREAPPVVLQRFYDLEIRRLTAAGHATAAWTVAQKLGIDPANRPDVFSQQPLIPYLRAYIARDLGFTGGVRAAGGGNRLCGPNG